MKKKRAAQEEKQAGFRYGKAWNRQGNERRERTVETTRKGTTKNKKDGSTA